MSDETDKPRGDEARVVTMAKSDDRPDSAHQPTDVIVAAVAAWIDDVAVLHREVALVLEDLRKLPLPGTADERLSKVVVALRQRQAQAPTRAAVETWVRSIAGAAGRVDPDSPCAG